MKLANDFREFLSELDVKISHKKANEFANMFLDHVKKEIKENGSFHLKGVGTFVVKKLSSRVLTNIHTGEKFTVPERQTVKFRISKKFKEELN